MTIDELILITEQQVRDTRRLLYLINSEQFKLVYNGLEVKDQAYIVTLILKNNLLAVNEWLEGRQSRLLEENTVVELRAIAQDLAVKDNHLMTKVELLGIIYARREQKTGLRNESSCNGVVRD